MLSGANFRVDPVVAGYLSIYTLHTRFGDVRVASSALLAKRIAETAALAKMEQVSSLKEFGGGIVNTGESTLQGAANLVTNPVGTISGALTGVGRMFENFSQDPASGNIGNGSGAAKLLGVPALERQYAAQFSVDPYTTNPLVRKRLHDLAVAGAAGNITATALSSLIPGGAGIAVSAVDLTAPPEALARQNLSQLAGMGVPAETAAFFIGDQTFTPTQQTRIVASLAAMPTVQNKGALVGFLADTNDPEVARFRERMATMYAGYNATVSPLSGFVSIGRHVAAMNAAGTRVLVFPADCFFGPRPTRSSPRPSTRSPAAFRPTASRYGPRARPVRFSSETCVPWAGRSMTKAQAVCSESRINSCVAYAIKASTDQTAGGNA